MFQVLMEGIASTTRTVVSTMTAFCRSKIVLSMAEKVAKRLVALGLEFLLFGDVKRSFGGIGGIASVFIFILEIIIDLKPWKKD